MCNDGQGTAEQVILATGGYDHSIKLWQAHTGVCQRTVQHTDSKEPYRTVYQQVNALDITPDKQLIAAAGYQHIRMYDLSSTNPSPVINYEGVSKNVTGVGFQEEGKWMYTGGEDCSARIWDLRSRNLQCQRIFQVSAPVNCVCLHPNQAELVVGDQSGVIHLWDLKTDHNEQLVTMLDRQFHISRCPVKKEFEKFLDSYCLLVTTSADMTVRIWKTSNFTLMRELKLEAQRWVWDAAFSADSTYILTASSDGVARLWNVETGTVEREYSGHQKAITSLAFRDELVKE
uniref:Target of rapamycin complex subunit lst8 n=1 Tax=Timema shepardi TaxID=629360 RepID=A0A7R9APB3_TIMSH|nr:unnamed protein product [Timema shepardi]